MKRWITAIIICLGLSFSPFGPNAEADQAQQNREAIAKAGGGDLAQKIASCEGIGTNDPFQGKPIQESVDLINSGQTHDWGTAKTRWGSYSCWHGGGGGGGGKAKRRSAPPPPPTGTRECNRDSGKWNCHPSWTLPDALTISPTIETDPGPDIIGCSWREVESSVPIWRCDVVKEKNYGL